MFSRLIELRWPPRLRPDLAGWRRRFSRVAFRLLAFNLILVFLPALGILSLEIYEKQLLDLQERSMVQQGRLLAAALEEHDGLDSQLALRILERMDLHFDARLRLLDTFGNVVADSSQLGPRRETDLSAPYSASRTDLTPDLRDNLLYRFGKFIYRAYAKLFLPPEPPSFETGLATSTSRLIGAEINDAMRGRYGSAIRRSLGGQRSLTMSSALPVWSRGKVVGVVLVTKSTFQILGALYELRLAIWQVLLYSLLAAIALSLYLSWSIVRPIRQLVQQSNALLDRRGRLLGRFAASQRFDEVGDLSRALAELTRRLELHLKFIEDFAADVSHELKNPLASIKSANEMLTEVNEPAATRRFSAIIRRDVLRLEKLIRGVREIGRLDADLEALPSEDVELVPLLETYLEGASQREGGQNYALEVEAPANLVVRASPDRLAQVLDNLVENARSFTPAGGTITVRLKQEGRVAVLEVEDQGPGIPPEHLEKIFDRFFSWRPGDPKRHAEHTGLGLAIVKAIVEGYGGAIEAESPASRGAMFRIRLPLAR